MDRRNFIKSSLLVTAASACSSFFPSLALANATPKRILVLGGTLFWVPHLLRVQ
jgi:hypothetical protein